MRSFVVFLLFFTLLGCCGNQPRADILEPCNITIAVFYHKDLGLTSRTIIKSALKKSADDFNNIAGFEFKYPDFKFPFCSWCPEYKNFQSYQGDIIYESLDMARWLKESGGVAQITMFSILFTDDKYCFNSKGERKELYGFHFDNVIVIFRTNFLNSIKLKNGESALQSIIEHEVAHFLQLPHSDNVKSYMHEKMSIYAPDEEGFDEEDVRLLRIRRDLMCK